MIRALLVLLAVAFAGCASTSSAEASSSQPVEVGTPAPGVVAALYRGPCLGRCPVYQVEVRADGSVRFRGERHVAQVGEFFGQLTPAQLEAVTQLFADRRFDTFATRYEHLDTSDLPLVVIAFRGKIVRHAHGDSGAPPDLTQLEDDFDALVGTAEWVKGPTK